MNTIGVIGRLSLGCRRVASALPLSRRSEVLTWLMKSTVIADAFSGERR